MSDLTAQALAALQQRREADAKIRARLGPDYRWDGHVKRLLDFLRGVYDADEALLTAHTPDRCGVAQGGLWVGDCIAPWPCSVVASVLARYLPTGTGDSTG